jgi:hypothetical protein
MVMTPEHVDDALDRAHERRAEVIHVIRTRVDRDLSRAFDGTPQETTIPLETDRTT